MESRCSALLGAAVALLILTAYQAGVLVPPVANLVVANAVLNVLNLGQT